MSTTDLTNKRQRGFTLLELLVALALLGVIIPVIVMATIQVWSTNDLSANRMMAISQLDYSLTRLGRDAHMAQDVTLNGSSFPLIFKWTTWDGTTNSVNYSVQNETLRRVNSVNIGQAGSYNDSSVVARNFNSGLSTLNYTNHILTVNITVSLAGYRPVSESRIGTFVSNIQ